MNSLLAQVNKYLFVSGRNTCFYLKTACTIDGIIHSARICYLDYLGGLI